MSFIFTPSILMQPPDSSTRRKSAIPREDFPKKETGKTWLVFLQNHNSFQMRKHSKSCPHLRKVWKYQEVLASNALVSSEAQHLNFWAIVGAAPNLSSKKPCLECCPNPAMKTQYRNINYLFKNSFWDWFKSSHKQGFGFFTLHDSETAQSQTWLQHQYRIFQEEQTSCNEHIVGTICAGQWFGELNMINILTQA